MQRHLDVDRRLAGRLLELAVRLSMGSEWQRAVDRHGCDDERRHGADATTAAATRMGDWKMGGHVNLLAERPKFGHGWQLEGGVSAAAMW